MLHERLRILCKTLNLSQREFSLRIGLSPGYFNKIYKGNALPSDHILFSIETVFSVNRQWLKTGEGPMFKDDAVPWVKKKLLDAIDTLDEEQIIAVTAFLKYLKETKEENNIT